MQSNEDVTMTDDATTTSTFTASTTSTTVAITTVPDSTAQSRRTDHDWQLYYLPAAPLPQSRPHASQNLISLYHLDDIATSVRRTDPTTGQKINKIRKSYEGKVKQLHIAGVNKAVPVPKEFINGGLLDWPADQWQAQKVSGNPVQKGLTPSFLAKLDRAVKMAPGKLADRDSEKWKKLIGTDEVPKGKVVPEAMKKGAALFQSQPTYPSTAPSPRMGATGARPARAGAKRRYNDSSFRGYAEGFGDEDLTNISEDDSRGMGGNPKKKRRKVRKLRRSYCYTTNSWV